MWEISPYSRDCQLENKINSLEVSGESKSLMINLMINKEDNNTDTEEENQVLVTQEISSEESSMEDSEKENSGICNCSYKTINLISENSNSHDFT